MCSQIDQIEFFETPTNYCSYYGRSEKHIDSGFLESGGQDSEIKRHCEKHKLTICSRKKNHVWETNEKFKCNKLNKTGSQVNDTHVFIKIQPGNVATLKKKRIRN